MKAMHNISRQTEFRADETYGFQLVYFEHILKKFAETASFRCKIMAGTMHDWKTFTNFFQYARRVETKSPNILFNKYTKLEQQSTNMANVVG